MRFVVAMVILSAPQASDILCSWSGSNARVSLFSDDCCTLNLKYFLCIMPQKKSASNKLNVTPFLLVRWWGVGGGGWMVSSVVLWSLSLTQVPHPWMLGQWPTQPAHPSVILSSPEFTVLNPACNLPLLEIRVPVFFPQLQWDFASILKMMVFVAPLPK